MATVNDDQSKTCVVIGGRSFVGKFLVNRLLKLGNWIVRVADSTHSDHKFHDSHALSTGRVFYFDVDLRNKKSIINAIEGSSAVFYVDDDDACNYDFYSGYTIIVQGVKNVINACRECKVRRLVYNSTADVVVESSHDIHNGNETLLYATKFKNVYSELKAQAEALVLHANDIDGLLTCALRPCNIFGPGDKQLLPSLVDVAKSSWAKFIIGSDGCMSDYTYVENVAHGLICAEAALDSHRVTVSGKVFFITNFEPVSSWEFSLLMLERLGYYRPMVKLPPVVVRLVVRLIKWMYSKSNVRNTSKSVSVYNIVRLMSHTTTFNCSAAHQQIEYSPVVSLDEGLISTIESFSHLAKDSSFIVLDEPYEQSKMEQLLGGGEVAEVLLWRDERKSFLSFLGVASLFYWFCLCERTLVSSTAQLLLLVIVFLYGYARLSHENFSMSTEMSNYVRSVLCEMDIRSYARTIVNTWNGGSHVVRLLAQGGDWSLFLKVVVLLYLFKWFIINSFPTSLGIASAFSFLLFFFYEQYEEEIEGLLGVLNELLMQFVESLSSSLPNASNIP